MKPVRVPSLYDSITIFLTDRCPLRCAYCTTERNDTKFISGTDAAWRLAPQKWIDGLNRLELPVKVPLTFTGGEPFIYPGIWEVLDGVQHEMNILTALPKTVGPEKFTKVRGARPSLEVTYHPGQNTLEDLLPRIKALQSVVSVTLCAIDHPATKNETRRAKELCLKNGVTFRVREFLGSHEGKLYGTYKYKDAAAGRVVREQVACKSATLIFGPDGASYRCHSDLYHKRKELVLGNITDPGFEIHDAFRSCKVYGMCDVCDVGKSGKSSVTIQFPEQQQQKKAA